MHGPATGRLINFAGEPCIFLRMPLASLDGSRKPALVEICRVTNLDPMVVTWDCGKHLETTKTLNWERIASEVQIDVLVPFQYVARLVKRDNQKEKGVKPVEWPAACS